MAVEIERKFLVRGEAWRAGAQGVQMIQGYLCREAGRVLRVRVAGQRARLTLKGPSTGASRAEFEYDIPLPDARAMLAELCVLPPVEKTRYHIQIGAHTWDLDVFEGANHGLVMAEIELSAPNEPFERPPWLGREVTEDPRFYNVYLAEHPYPTWAEA